MQGAREGAWDVSDGETWEKWSVRGGRDGGVPRKGDEEMVGGGWWTGWGRGEMCEERWQEMESMKEGCS